MMSNFEQIGNFVKGGNFTQNLNDQMLNEIKILKEFAMIIRHKINNKITTVKSKQTNQGEIFLPHR